MQRTIRQEIISSLRVHIEEACRQKHISSDEVAEKAGLSHWSWKSFMQVDVECFRDCSPGADFFRKLIALNITYPGFWDPDLKRMLRRLVIIDTTGDPEFATTKHRRVNKKECRKKKRDASSKLRSSLFADVKYNVASTSSRAGSFLYATKLTLSRGNHET